jgi:hypothetical protein
MGAHVLAVVGQAEQPPGAAAVDPGNERLADLAAAARARIVAADRDQIEQLEAGLLARFAPGDLGRALARLDHAGDRLEQPGVAVPLEGADPELLDQHDLRALRIVGQNHHRRVALEQLAHQLRPHAAGEQAVAQAIADDLEEAVENDFPLDHLDPRIGHDARARGGAWRGGLVQVNALNAIRVKVSLTPSRVCTRLVTKRPMSVSSSR